MSLKPLDVIWIDDETIAPPAPKMVACIHPENGWFYRINSRSHWKPAVWLPHATQAAFLSHDSFLECGDPLELDDYVVEESIRRRGIIGCVAAIHSAEIIAALIAARYLKQRDKDEIRLILAPFLS
jgi:hypothetical protein